jgi:type II secretory pathway pseudopilin PulG
VIALGCASQAHAADTATADQLKQLQEQLQALQKQIDALKASQDKQAADTAKVVEAAKAKPAPSPVASWADNTHVGGKIYADASYIDQTSKGVDTDAKGYGIDVKRGYLIIDHTFDDMWSANVTTDFNYSSVDGEAQVFIKKAYVQARLNEYAAVRLGSTDMPWIPYVENLYGYRYVEQTFVDKNKFGNSADWGVNIAGGNLGMFNYSASVVNGGGYKNPTRSDSADFEGRIGITPIKGLDFALGGYSGDRGQDVHSNPTEHTADRWDILGNYNAGNWRFGAEYFEAKNWNTVQGAATDKSDGYSLWGNFGLSHDWNIFARYDHLKPKKDLDPSLKDEYWNTGVEWLAIKGVKLAAVYKYDRLKNDRVGALHVDTKTDEFGIFTEISF